MRFNFKYKNQDLGISSSRYILNHFESLLQEKGMINEFKSDNELSYHYDFNNLLFYPTFGGRCMGGRIYVNILDNEIEVILKYIDYFAIIGMILIIFSISAYLIFADFREFFPFALLGIAWIFGGHFFIRFIAQKKLFKLLNNLLIKL